MIDFDKIIDNKVLSPPKGHPHREAIKSFPSHEYPEITKVIQSIKEEL